MTTPTPLAAARPSRRAFSPLGATLLGFALGCGALRGGLSRLCADRPQSFTARRRLHLLEAQP